MKTILKIIGVLFLFLFMALIAINYKLSKPIAFDDSDLIFQSKSVDPSANGFVILLPALKEMKLQEFFDKWGEEIRDLSSVETDLDVDRANAIIHENSNLLNQLAGALQVDSFQVPFEESFMDSRKEEKFLKELLIIGRLEVVYIRLLISNQNYDEAGYGIEKLMKFGHLLQSSENNFLIYWLGVDIKKNANKLLGQWIKESQYEAQYYKNYSDRIAPYLNNNGMDISLKIEYSQISNTIRKMSEGKKEYKRFPKGKWILGGFLYNESRTLNEAARYFHQEIKNVNGDFDKIRHISVISRDSASFRLINYFTGNFMGKVMIDMMLPNFDGIVEQIFEFNARCNLIRLKLAIKTFKVQNNKLLDSLDQLVPEYLQQIPLDPFDKKPMRYNQQNRSIYSVGSDLMDGGGEKDTDIALALDF